MARLVGLDLARLAAIVGMMAAHLLTEAAPGWTATASDGFPSTLFAVIGGVSAHLASRRLLDGRRTAAVLALVARGLVVLAAGIVLEALPTYVYVVLVYFGLTLIVAAPLVAAPSWVLAAVAVPLAVLGPQLNAAVRPGLADDAVGDLDGSSPLALLLSVVLTGTYPVVTWLVYVALGMLVGRLLAPTTRALPRTGIRVRALAAAAAGAGAALVAVVADAALAPALVVAPLAGRLSSPVPVVRSLLADGGTGAPLATGWPALVSVSPHTGSTGDILRTAGVAVLVVGLLVAVAPGALRLPSGSGGSRVRRWAGVPARAGAAPLTIYSLHIVVTAIALIATGSMSGLALWHDDAGWGALALHVALALAIGALLVATGRRGPLETVAARGAASVARLASRPSSRAVPGASRRADPGRAAESRAAGRPEPLGRLAWSHPAPSRPESPLRPA